MLTKMMIRSFYVLIAAHSVVGCKRDVAADTAAPQTDQEPTSAALPSSGEVDGDDVVASLVVDETILEMCSLAPANFDFNSSTLTSADVEVLDAVADCFLDGPATGKGLLLIGHADPRGENDYNLALGQRRADSVSAYVQRRGLPAERVETSSRGELDATGTDDAGWAADRRVDIKLADEE